MQKSPTGLVALLAEGVDRNHVRRLFPAGSSQSPSSRRAWIEILTVTTPYFIRQVALLAEGVDRNRKIYKYNLPLLVALLAEGVDRNSNLVSNGLDYARSPSSRRAWIEIFPSR